MLKLDNILVAGQGFEIHDLPKSSLSIDTTTKCIKALLESNYITFLAMDSLEDNTVCPEEKK